MWQRRVAVKVIHALYTGQDFSAFDWDSAVDANLVAVGLPFSPSLSKQLLSPPNRFYEGYQDIDETSYAQDFVVQAPGPWAADPHLRGELIYVRRVEEDEVFDGPKSLLILSPYEITEVTGDFAQAVFASRHGESFSDAHNAVFDAAFELLLEEVGRDYEQCFARPWPDQLPDAITDVLRPLNLYEVSRVDIMSLAAEIIRLVPGPE
jgi:hypothetical protein